MPAFLINFSIDFEAAKWDYGVIFLGALAMQLGARVAIQQIGTLHKPFKCTDLYDEAKAQMQKGLNNYNNIGDPYNPKSPLGVNVIEDPKKMPQPMSMPKQLLKRINNPRRKGGRGERPPEKMDSEISVC